MLVANRMQLTCPPNRVHMSSHFREELELADVGSSFEYEQQRKTIVRGRVTVSSYLVRTANVAVPEHFVGKLKITHAHHPRTSILVRMRHKRGPTLAPSQTRYPFASSQRSGTSHNSNPPQMMPVPLPVEKMAPLLPPFFSSSQNSSAVEYWCTAQKYKWRALHLFSIFARVMP